MDREADYIEYKKRLRFPQWAGKVEVIAFATFNHQAAMLRSTLNQVTTPLMMFCEHDWMIVGDIPWDAMANIVLERKADYIRLSQEQTVHPEHEHLFMETVEINGVKLRKQRVLWCQPFICRVDWMRKLLAEKFTPYCRTFIEDALYGLCLEPAKWGEPDRLFMYAPDGGYKRVSHQDGRGKHEDGSPLVPKWDEELIF
jgi:hypothetical protein